MVHGLTARQKAVLTAIQAYWDTYGVAPSLANLATALGISRSTVHEHILALKRKGHLVHIEGASRTWRLIDRPPSREIRRIPVVGRIAAGRPILAAENIEDWIIVEEANPSDTLFGLRVQGDSMVGAGILDGDVVIVRQQETADDGEIVVALVDDEEATIKRLQQRGDMIMLVAENHSYEPIECRHDRVRVQGKVLSVRRQLNERGER